jgi:hypothetical protein
MSTIVLRSVKGSPLTNTEVDDNFNNLNTDKYQSGASPSFATITASSNLTFTGTGNRITGNFSTLTIADRVSFQSSIVDGTTAIMVLPNGTATSSSIQAVNNSDPSATSRTTMSVSSTESRFEAGRTASGGTYLPMTFVTGGSERIRVDTSGNVGVGTASPGYKLDVQSASATINLQSTTTTNLSYLTLRNVGYNYVGVENSVGGGLFTGSSAYALALGTVSAYPVQFATGGTVRATIDPSGNVGIGTSSPAVKLAINSTDAILLPKGTTAQQPTGVAGYLRFNTTRNEFEGYNGTAWASVGGSALSNDTSTTSSLYPVFAGATSGTALNLYTSNAKLLYKPSTGDLSSTAMVSNNGVMINADSVSSNYTIQTGTNGFSVGPLTVNSGVTITVSSGQRHVII